MKKYINAELQIVRLNNNDKKYINAELQIVRLNNNDVIVTSMNTPNNQVGNGTQLAPERRKSIWD